MCEDEGTRGGDGSAEAARFGVVGKGRGVLCQWFRWGGGTVDDKLVGSGERYARKSPPQPGRRMKGGKVTGRKEMGGTETGGDKREGDVREREGGKETGAKGTKATWVKMTIAQDNQETRGKGDMLMAKKEMNNMLSCETTTGQNTQELL